MRCVSCTSSFIGGLSKEGNKDEYDRITDGGRCKEALLPGGVPADPGGSKRPDYDG